MDRTQHPRLIRLGVGKILNKRRLADAGFSTDQYDAPSASPRRIQGGIQFG